jgi:branched-chain amino acid transport system ATP-binding protein
MLKIDHLSAGYGSISVLTDVSLNVQEGEVVGLIGTNGGGKTTLLKTISGILHPFAGSIEFLGERIDLLHPKDICKMGLIHVPAGRQLFPQMTVIENLEMGAYLPGARRGLHESLDRVFQLFPLFSKRKGQKAGLLSGGEQQMLAIARALMSKPRLLMLDEPSEGLSPVMTQMVFDTLKILGDQGLTILVVSQEVSLALELSTRGYVLENGLVTLENTSAALLCDDKVREAYLGI